MYERLSKYFDNKLSKFQCGFRKGYSAQHCLAVMIEKWRKVLDKGGSFGVLLTDLSKTFDCLPHDLLIAKLHSYGLNRISLELLLNYLTKRKQRVRIGRSFSEWQEILTGVPQGSILGPLLFNIYLCDLFLVLEGTDIASYADDNSPYSCNKTIEAVSADLEGVAKVIFNWCIENGMKANSEKSHVILSRSSNLDLTIGDSIVTSSECQKLLGVYIDMNLTFDTHVSNLCNKASQKLHALARVAPYMSLFQRRIVMKSFFCSQFGYCPLVWMFHSKKLNNRINNLQEVS